jgi:hypothetical protein
MKDQTFTFGKSGEEAKAESRGGDSASDWMRYPSSKEATQLRILDEPKDWKWFWEHYPPQGEGYPYPCTGDRDNCPGCNAVSDKERKASRKIAFNAHDGQYTNIWKVGKSIADKLEMRFDRLKTIRDRDYLITPFKADNGFTNYDVEGLDKEPINFEYEEYLRDPEELLKVAYEQSWGPIGEAPVKQPKPEKSASSAESKTDTGEAAKTDDPPWDEAKAEEKPKGRSMKAKKATEKKSFVYDPEHEYTDEELRQMEPWDVLVVAKEEGFGEAPKHLITSGEIVDWMVEQMA